MINLVMNAWMFGINVWFRADLPLVQQEHRSQRLG
jgi:hypothetical protein